MTYLTDENLDFLLTLRIDYPVHDDDEKPKSDKKAGRRKSVELGHDEIRSDLKAIEADGMAAYRWMPRPTALHTSS